MNLPQVSPSSLGIINPDLGQECPRCFWHDRWDKKAYKKDQPTACQRPRGIFPSLPGGIDRILKTMADKCAPKLPAFLEDQEAMLDYTLYPDRKSLAVWMNAFKGLSVEHAGVTLKGAVDDLLVRGLDGKITPIDWKTRGSAPKPDAPDYYGLQLDCYGYLAENNGLDQTGEGYLCYFWPVVVSGSSVDAVFGFDTELQHKTLRISRIPTLLEYAAEVLAGPEPAAGEKCEQCAFVDGRRPLAPVS